MSERTDALKLAHRLLDEPNIDPDDDLRVLARQLVRRTEQLEAMHRKFRELDWEGVAMRDMINANRDEMLKKHEEAVSMVQRALSTSDTVTASRVLKALNLFHPMHPESWPGWPEGA